MSGLSSLAARTDRVKRWIVVFLGDHPQRLDGVDVLPLADFLRQLPA